VRVDAVLEVVPADDERVRLVLHAKLFSFLVA